MMPKFLISSTFLFIFYISSAVAQTVSIESILATYLQDEKVISAGAMANFSDALNYKLPAVKKLEFRLGINGNNSPDTLDGSLRNEDYYSVNLTTNKWKEMKLQKKLKPIQTNLYHKEQEMLITQALLDRYLVIVNLYYSLESLKNRKELQDLLLKKNDLLKQLLNDGVTIKITDALEIDKDLVQLFVILQEEERDIDTYYARLRQYFSSSDTFQVNFSDLITMKKVIANTSTLKYDSITSHPSLVYREAQYQFAQANYNLEHIQNTNILNSFQLGYNRPVYNNEILKKFKPENTLTFRVGISVPLTGNNNLNRNNANLEQYNAMLNWQNAQAIQTKYIILQDAKLNLTIKQYQAFEEIYKNSIVAKLLENEKIMAQSTALEILDLKIAKKKLELNLNSSASNVMRNYLLLIESKGILNFDLRHQYLLEK